MLRTAQAARESLLVICRSRMVLASILFIPDKSDKARGMNITFVTTAKGSDEARDFLKYMGMPFRAKQ